MEIWPKNDFSCFYYRFFTKNVSSPSFFRISICKWARSKAYDIAQKVAVGFSDIRYQTRENGAQNGRCRPKMRFFAVAMATGYRSAVFASGALPRHVLRMCVKFHRDRASRLGSRSDTDKQTNKPSGVADLRLSARLARLATAEHLAEKNAPLGGR